MTQSQNSDNPFRPEDAPASSANPANPANSANPANPAKNIGRRDMLGMAIAAAAALGMASPARALGSTLGMTPGAGLMAPDTRTVTATIPSGTIPSQTLTATKKPPGEGTVMTRVTLTETYTTEDPATFTVTRTGVVTQIQSGTVVTLTFPSGTYPSQTVTATIPGPRREELPGDGQYAGLRIDLRELRAPQFFARRDVHPLA